MHPIKKNIRLNFLTQMKVTTKQPSSASTTSLSLDKKAFGYVVRIAEKAKNTFPNRMENRQTDVSHALFNPNGTTRENGKHLLRHLIVFG